MLKHLYEMRKRALLSQSELAMKVGVTQGAVSQWEKGTATPSVDKLLLVSQALNCTVDELIKEQ